MKVQSWLIAGVGVFGIVFASAAMAQETPVRRGWLGFSYEASADDGAQTVRIAEVYPGSPAAEAGVRSGDEIVRWNGSPEVVAALKSLRLEAGDTVRLRLRRGDERDRDLRVIAARRPRRLAIAEPGEAPRIFGMSQEQWKEWQQELRDSQEEIARLFGEEARKGGFRMDSLGPEMGRLWEERIRLDSLALNADSLHKDIRLMLRDSLGPQLRALGERIRFHVSEGPTRTVIAVGRRSVAGAEFETMNEGLASYFGTDGGALVLSVSPGTPADDAGLRPGDVVLEANGREVESVDELRDAVARAQRSQTRSVQLEVLRRGEREQLDLSWE